MNLATIFHPTPTADFLVDHFNVQPLCAPGAAARFAALAESSFAEAVAYDLERELEAPIRIEPVAEGGEPRLAPHDVIALQLAGETHWQVYGCAAAALLAPGQIISLQPGSALYLPRTFWRTTHSSGAGPRSCVFHIQNPTGAGLLIWMANKFQENEAFQADIPRFASPAIQAAYLTRLRKSFGSWFREPSLLRRYATRLNRLAPEHPAAGLPWTDDAPVHMLIALAAPRRPVILRTDRETIHIFLAGRDIHFPEDAAPLLQYVIHCAPVSIAAFYGQFEGEFDRDELASFLSALSRDGVITLLAPEPV